MLWLIRAGCVMVDAICMHHYLHKFARTITKAITHHALANPCRGAALNGLTSAVGFLIRQDALLPVW